MGDNRCTVKLEVQGFHGISRSIEMNINLTEDDERITDWFSSVYHDGMYRYQETMRKECQKEEERKERDLYERLKSKYEAQRE